MTKYCEILRLHGLGFNARNIALAVPCSRNTVSKVLKQATEKETSWLKNPVQGNFSSRNPSQQNTELTTSLRTSTPPKTSA